MVQPTDSQTEKFFKIIVEIDCNDFMLKMGAKKSLHKNSVPVPFPKKINIRKLLRKNNVY